MNLRSLIALLCLALVTVGCGGDSTGRPPTGIADRNPSQPTAAPTGAATGSLAQPTGAATTGPDSLTAPPREQGGGSVILATTTSTQDTGLLDVLLGPFEQTTGYSLKIIAVGTGQALALGERGEADVLLVHAPASELEFMATGAGVDRRLVMHNDFVLVGPKSDPAAVRGSNDPVAAMKAIASSAAAFYSRGDDSGTHKKELSLWESADAKPEGGWYRETGTGMGQTLRTASEKQAYTLTDRATYLSLQQTLDLELLVEGGKPLLNVYHVIRVNPERFPKVAAEGARAWADFLVSSEAQAIIGAFGREKYGEPLFVPDAGKSEDALGGAVSHPAAAPDFSDWRLLRTGVAWS